MSGRPVLPCECGDHLFANATKGFVILVSPEDRAALDIKWKAHVRKRDGYVTILSSGDGDLVLARVITEAPKGKQADHKNHNTCDNRRPNLRVCDHAQNSANRRGNRGRTLPKGVYLYRGRYFARIAFEGRNIYCGGHVTAEEAKRAYDAKALELYGEFAVAA